MWKRVPSMKQIRKIIKSHFFTLNWIRNETAEYCGENVQSFFYKLGYSTIVICT